MRETLRHELLCDAKELRVMGMALDDLKIDEDLPLEIAMYLDNIVGTISLLIRKIDNLETRLRPCE